VRKNTLVLVFSLVALLGMTRPASADWAQRQKITSTPRGVGAQFGNAMAISGTTMIIGARNDSTTASQAGAAMVYVRNGSNWTQQAKLLANDGALGDKFGYSVTVSGDTVVIGAYNDDGPFADTGSAYVFTRSGTTWTQQQKLTASDGTASDEFGNAVAIDGDVIAVGAHFADLPSNAASGSVYLFQRSGTAWTPTQKLIPIPGPFPVPAGFVQKPFVNYSPILGDHFGESIAMNGGRMAVGASTSDLPATSAGAVYVFAGAGGSYALQQKLVIPDGTNGDIFGCSVALDGTTLIGGAREDSPVPGKPAYGAAYVFELAGGLWNLQGKLSAADGASVDRFGWSVAVSKDVVAIGAREDDTTVGPDAGSVYVFVRSGSTWTQKQKLAPTDTFNGDRFGTGVAFISSYQLVVGAAEKALSGPNGQGAAYTFETSRTMTAKPTRFDYDGDGKADPSVFRPSNGQWSLQQSSENAVRSATFGQTTDKPVPADYDGDGITDLATYRPSSGEWSVLRSSSQTPYSLQFGISTDIPVPADFDGDGKADFAVFRPTAGTWYISKATGEIQITQWGAAGDIPMPADYDGDGKADFAIFRPADGTWWLNRTTAGISSTTFGVGTDKPAPADFTGDGKTDIAVWRPGSGSWYVLRSEDSSFFAVSFGASGDVPAPADYDGDGKADFAVFRPNGANWYIQRSTAGVFIQQFGQAGDQPTPAAYIP
jgi:hypothetical protein